MKPNLGAKRVCLVSLLLLALAGCAPTGDFGRKQAFAGGLFAQAGASSTLSDEEREMTNRMERFVVAPGKPSSTVSLTQNAAGPSGEGPQTGDYYLALRQENFATPRTRYARMLNDIQLDILTLPALFSSICQVREIDRRRQVAADGLPRISSEALAAQTARRAGNEGAISGFVAALSFRQDGYGYALEQLLVATPHEQARAVDAGLNELAVFVASARAGRFCS